MSLDTLASNRPCSLKDLLARMEGRAAKLGTADRKEDQQVQDMAKALQRLAATSADRVQRHALDWLREKMQYSSPMRKFKESLKAAMHELERVGVIAGSRIELSSKGKEQAVWVRVVDK
ncbi:hypothetical protein [Ralstonia mannitolilytica]|uniref:hypothetical protein n=1 Tax=Ralstonia mannitolilytica TaxID=105219 RepID=UPI003B842252